MTLDMQTTILTKVNAPYQNYLEADALADAISNGRISVGQVASFFTETSVDVQRAFAKEFDISEDQLTRTAKSFTVWTGQAVALLR